MACCATALIRESEVTRSERGAYALSVQPMFTCKRPFNRVRFAKIFFLALALSLCAYRLFVTEKMIFRSYASTFFRNCLASFVRNMPHLSPATPELLKQWDWPGNLRELENWIARAVILGGDEALVVELKRQLKPSNGLVGRQPGLEFFEECSESSFVPGYRRIDSESLAGESVEQAKDRGRTEDELSCVAFQIAECGYASEAQKSQGASTRTLVCACRGSATELDARRQRQ